MSFWCKMKGRTQSPPRVRGIEIFWSWVGALLGIGVVAYLHYQVLGEADAPLIIGSFGASAVLIYGAIHSPLAQPRNLVGGHLISAVIGVSCYHGLTEPRWLAAAIAVATAIAAMHATKTLHPPGGATALIAVIGSERIHQLGYFYVIMPVGVGALVMLGIALLVNNLAQRRHYPDYWW